jgi:hypothetical protein
MIYPRTFDLAYWINEREAMRLRREAGLPSPWSHDPAMATVRYCNVHREDDKVTRWLRSNPVYSHFTTPVWVIVLSRMVNRIETLDLIQDAVYRSDLKSVSAALKYAREYRPIWGNAYTISTCGKTMDKVDYVLWHVVSQVQESEALCEKTNNTGWGTLLGAFEWLTEVDGLGSFLAAQVVADLKNIPGHALQSASDWLTWCAPGPGSLRGLAAFYGRTSTPRTFNADITECYNLVMPLVEETVGPIHMQDFQNCLCEFSKYARVKEGGRARNRYDPSVSK